MTDTDDFTQPIYRDDDADERDITNKTVAVLGYGSQGHAHAQNLDDSGVDVVVGLRKSSASWDAAEADGLDVATPVEAAEQADVVSMLVPDTVQPSVYADIEDAIQPGDTLQFAHGFNIHYGQIDPKPGVDVTMIAPKSPGHLVRRNYEAGEGTPALLAVHRDETGEAKSEALAYAQAIGCARAGVLETTFQEETESDLFGEQAVLCGGVTSLIKAGYETLVENGYSPEMAYFECMNEMKLIVDLMYEGGLGEMWDSVSDTAEYGGLVEGDEVVDEHVRENMQETLDRVQNGEFATRWIAENQAGRPSFNQRHHAERNHEIEDVGERLRGLFAWAEQETEREPEKTEAEVRQ
ncbi:ketol-acid reductoisomerase [Halocalculus aciditolerans]|uniref:Ketol-acid reductoisomerase (NADP(+)) n=1 Tax=Halocalculus aciditolerans TaxID=1383812 RepID=A0A830F117_9EURY|nr:ketol-acid reductoisomerase [Halocalculus aciditolerans]GGL52098.1 ketol-acid reductoisomerase (NADP(+)) [Halocalculus aciditolerans]